MCWQLLHGLHHPTSSSGHGLPLSVWRPRTSLLKTKTRQQRRWDVTAVWLASRPFTCSLPLAQGEISCPAERSPWGTEEGSWQQPARNLGPPSRLRTEPCPQAPAWTRWAFRWGCSPSQHCCRLVGDPGAEAPSWATSSSHTQKQWHNKHVWFQSQKCRGDLDAATGSLHRAITSTIFRKTERTVHFPCINSMWDSNTQFPQ